MISTVACCYSAKLCAHAARAFLIATISLLLLKPRLLRAVFTSSRKMASQNFFKQQILVICTFGIFGMKIKSLQIWEDGQIYHGVQFH